jgi:tRNA threonylcarbamoyladenosine biosynthesis protein TsaE
MTAVVVTEAALQEEGLRLGRTLPSRSVIWLVGALGAGKTTLVRAIARGRGVAGRATSPTYALVHHYEAPTGPVYHVDCYRLRRPEEASDLDWATLMAADLLLIEWPERAGAWAPGPTHTITLTHAGTAERLLEIR